MAFNDGKRAAAAAALAGLLLVSGARAADDQRRQPTQPMPNVVTEAEKQAGFRPLFDGKTAAGWRGYKKDKFPAGWKVVDGALVRAASGAGDIITEEQFDAFELLIDYRIAPEGNSGIMFGVRETGDAPWNTGPEIQVQDNEKGHDPQKSGWLYQLYEPAKDQKTGKPTDATKPAGQWNTLRILIAPAGQTSTVWMNGVKYYDFVRGGDDWKRRISKSKFAQMSGFGAAAKGHICLQDHGDEVAFRNIKIRPIAGGNERAAK
jgi:hypothetical protein